MKNINMDYCLCVWGGF